MTRIDTIITTITTAARPVAGRGMGRIDADAGFVW